MNSYELSNLLATRVLDQIQRINGVATCDQFGSEYAMRIWLNPDKLHAYGLSPAQVLRPCRGQNVQVAAGSVGAAPTVPNSRLSINVSVPGRIHLAGAVREHHSAHRSQRHYRTAARRARLELGAELLPTAWMTRWTASPSPAAASRCCREPMS